MRRISVGAITTWFPDLSPLDGLVLDTSDVEAAHKTLTERGVAVSPIESAPWAKFAMLKDPDGNGWVIQEMAAGMMQG
ncbi:MAG: hypothetical protein GYB67_12390 [Chloroflexi bacterium]|nr:hypothetical protein [Chloroflexota bacterium]